MAVKEGHLQINIECQHKFFKIVTQFQIRFNNSQFKFK